MVQLITRILPREARRRRQALGGLPHAHFLYGKGVTLWAGGGSAFLIPRIAGLPVVNRRADTQALANVRRFLTEGPYPVALAPEGQVTYHNHLPGSPGNRQRAAGRLVPGGSGEAGAQRRGPGAAGGLRVPLPADQERLLEDLIARIARIGGLRAPEPGPARERLLDLTEQLIVKIEGFYARFFGGGPAAPAGLRERIERVCDAALRVPERFMGLPAARGGAVRPTCSSGCSRCGSGAGTTCSGGTCRPQAGPAPWTACWPTGWPTRLTCSCGTTSWSTCWSTCGRTTSGRRRRSTVWWNTP